MSQKTQKHSPKVNGLTQTAQKNSQGEGDQELKNQLARALADYANLKKRVEEERTNVYKMASVSVLLKVLPILDNLRSALRHVSDSGIAIIVGELETLLKEEGLEEIKLGKGDEFNESEAEAVEAVETKEKKDNNTVSEVLLSGWKYSDGTIVRHAKVKVYKYGR